MFDLKTGWWTWLSGAKTVDQSANYGAIGVGSFSNRPGARFFHSMVIDPSGKYLYLFGGSVPPQGTLCLCLMIFGHLIQQTV